MNNLNQKFTNDNNNNNYQQQQKTTKIHHSFRNCQSSLSLLMLFTTNQLSSICSTGFNSKFKWPLFYHKSTMFSIKIFIIHFLMIITTLLSTFNNNIVYANEFNEIWQPQAAQVFEIEYPSIVADDQSSLINSSSSSSNIKPNTETIDNSILKTKSTLLNVVNDLQPIKYEPELNYQNDVDDDQNFIVVNNNDGGNTLINENNLNDNDNDNDGNNVIDNNEFDDNDYYNDNDDDDDDDDKMLNSTSRLKREVFRGQNYHYQRGYELSRLRYENRLRTDPNAAKPKAFFLREYHQGRDVPREILRLTQGGLISEHPLTTTTKQSNSGGHDSDMKTMSDYQQQLFATKAALKAAIQSGDKDFSILDYLNKMKAKIDSDRRQQNSGGGGGASGGGRPSGNNVLIPTTGGAGTGGGMSGGNHPGTINPDHIIEQIKDIDQKHGGIDGGNLGVRFDEQLKEDLNKILPYDPSKQFGERIRPFRPSYIGSTPGSDQDQGSGGSNAGQSGGGGGVSSSPGGGAGGGSGSPADDYLNKISRLYPHLFPGHTGQGIPGARPSGGGGSGSSGYGPGSSDDGSGRPSGDSDGGNTGSGNRPGGGGSGGGSGPGSSAGSGAPYADGGSGGGSYSPSGGGSGSPSGQYGGGGSGSASGLGIRPAPLPPSYISPIGNRTGTYPPVPTLGTPASAYPARFPGRLLSALTLYPGVRNSTFPGFPGYIRIDYPGYNTVPYTGFRCELQPYKIGYYADVAASCQVFHICQRDGRMDSFLCPNGTLFHQKVMTCDWWYLVNCPASPSYYYLNGRIGVLPPLPATVGRFD